MLRHIISKKYFALFFFVVSALVLVFSIPQADAAISTSYQLVSQRPTGSSNTDRASIDNASSVSGNGRYVVFSSNATDLVSGDTNGSQDVFVRDTVNNITTRVSVSSSGVEADSYSNTGSISYDGRYVVFQSHASNLLTSFTTASNTHVYIRDLSLGTTNIVDTSTSGTIGDAQAYGARVSADGRYVVFVSNSTNLDPSFTYASVKYQVYIKDMHSGAVKALSVTSANVAGNDDSSMPDISCDGNVVAFASVASNLGVPTGQFGRNDLIIASLGWNDTELTDVTANTMYGINANAYGNPQVSCDGNVVLFISSSTDVVSPSTPVNYVNAYEYNRLTGNTVQVSLGNGDVQASAAEAHADLRASMSGDGRYVAFTSYANNMDTSVPDLYSGSSGDVYIRDVKNSTTELATISSTGIRSGWNGGLWPVSLSADASVLIFEHYTPTSSLAARGLNGIITSAPNGFTDVYKTTTGH